MTGRTQWGLMIFCISYQPSVGPSRRLPMAEESLERWTGLRKTSQAPSYPWREFTRRRHSWNTFCSVQTHTLVLWSQSHRWKESRISSLFTYSHCHDFIRLPALWIVNDCLLQQMWVFDEELGMNQREITYVPGLYKIFDEILGEWCHLVVFHQSTCWVYVTDTSVVCACTYIWSIFITLTFDPWTCIQWMQRITNNGTRTWQPLRSASTREYDQHQAVMCFTSVCVFVCRLSHVCACVRVQGSTLTYCIGCTDCTFVLGAPHTILMQWERGLASTDWGLSVVAG